MKSLDVFRDAHLPVPAEQAAELIAQHGHRLIPKAPDTDPFFAGIDCSADGRTVIGFGDEFLLVWNAEDSEPRERVRVSGKITCAAICSAGSTAIVGTASGDVLLFAIPGLDVIAQRHESTAIHAVDVSDINIGVFCDAQGKVTAFDYAKHEDLPPIGYEGSAGRVWLTHEAELLIIDDEQTIYLCHPKQGWLENTFYYQYQDGEKPALLASGWLVAKRENQVHIWNRPTASPAAVLVHDTPVCAFDMDGSMSTIATVTTDQKLHLHAPRDPSTQRHRSAAQTYIKEPHSIKLRGRAIFLGGEELTVLQVTRDNVPVRTYYDRLIPIVSAHVSANERWITVGDQAGGVTVYDTIEGRRSLDRLEIPEIGAVSVVDVDHDNDVIIAGGHDGALRVIRFGDSADVHQYDCGGATVQAACLANGYAYVGTNDGVVAKLDLNTGEQVQQFIGHSVLVRSTVVRGSRLITTDQSGGICVFDTPSAALLHRFQLSGTAYRTCLDESGQRLYAGARGGRIVCWDLDSGCLADEFCLNRSVPRYLQIRGDTLVSLGLEGDLQLFNLAQHRQTLAIDIPGPGWQRFVYLNKSGTRLMTAGADGILRFFCARSGAERARGLHLARGYCWFGNDDDGAAPEWLWTDQDELLDIVAQRGDEIKVLEMESDERHAFLLERNSKRTMSLLGLARDTETNAPVGAALDAPRIARRLTGPTG